MTDPIKAKIQELVPSKLWRYTCDHCPCGLVIEESPSLAVVLRAIEKGAGTIYSVHMDGTFLNREGDTGIQWNLEKDNYDQQSEECKQFIGSLLN